MPSWMGKNTWMWIFLKSIVFIAAGWEASKTMKKYKSKLTNLKKNLFFKPSTQIKTCYLSDWVCGYSRQQRTDGNFCTAAKWWNRTNWCWSAVAVLEHSESEHWRLIMFSPFNKACWSKCSRLTGEWNGVITPLAWLCALPVVEGGERRDCHTEACGDQTDPLPPLLSKKSKWKIVSCNVTGLKRI